MPQNIANSRFRLQRKKLLTGFASAIVLLLMLGYVTANPQASWAISISHAQGNSMIYGRVTSSGHGVQDVTVKLDTVKGRPHHQNVHVVALARTNKRGDYRKLSRFATGKYLIVVRNRDGKITGSRAVWLRRGRSYNISAHLVQHSKGFFFLPIFSY